MKRGGADVEIDLFPFLSILVCIMGVLSLMISAIVLSQINPASVAEVKEQIAEEKDLSNDLKKLDAELAALQQQLKAMAQQPTAQPLANRTADLDREIAAMEKKIAERQRGQQSAATEADRLQDRIDSLKARVAELTPEVAVRKDHVSKLEKELAERKEAAKGPAVRILPTGSGTIGSRRPVFVDCDAVALTIHDGSQPVTVQRPQLASHPAWQAVVKKAAADKNAILIFLIRRDGIPNYRAASAEAEKNGAVTGRIPVGWDGKLDLSLFGGGR